MDRELAGCWKITLEIQGFGRPAEYVPSAVASRSAETDYCKDGWKDARQKNEGKVKKMKEIIKIQMADAVVLAKAIIAEEDAEDAEEAEEDAAEEETTLSI
jgi:hypothetical protein